MNPVIVMAVYGRRNLVEINLRMLKDYPVIVVTSIQPDFDFVRDLHLPNIHLVSTANNPLGRKWQTGVDKAREFDANPLIILGSDDFLSHNFIERACILARESDFIFFDHWFIHAPKGQKNYHLAYNMFKFDKPPLGSGRIYSKALLERRDWMIFNTAMDWHLDNLAWETKHYEDRLCHNPKGMNILAVKGMWETMNPVEKILSSETIDWCEESDIDRHFNFEKPIKEIFQNL